MTEQIKDKLFRIWGKKITPYRFRETVVPEFNYAVLKRGNVNKSIPEIQALMQQDGIEPSEINKIIKGE